MQQIIEKWRLTNDSRSNAPQFSWMCLVPAYQNSHGKWTTKQARSCSDKSL